MNVQRVYALLFVLSGLLILFVALYLETKLPGIADVWEASLSLAQTVGIAFFGFGILNIVFETTNWRNYFEDRIQNIFRQQSFLRTLDPDSLNAIQTNVLKAQFKDQTIDREGSFLDYFLNSP